jgi:two-component system phosphate regulon sensor histidine kinase PhoR
MTQPADAPMIQNVIAAFPLPTLAIGGTEKIEYLNAAAEVLLGASVVGRHFTTVLRHPKLVDAIERDQVVRTVSYQVLENGRDAYYDVHVQMIAQTDLLLVSVQNATVLAQAEQMRRDFVANVSHELRTPLTAVMGFVETLRGPARDDAAARDRFLGIMAGEAERMNRLVGGLLSLSRVEAEQRVRPTTQLDLCTVLKSAICTLEPLTRDNNVTVHLAPWQDMLQVTGDADQLLQVFTNLLENAVKYGGADQSVEIEIARIDHDPVLRGPAIEVTVVDHGPGMESIHLPRLTERFYRADTHRSRDLGGTGLGLAIVKHILNRHRGRLKITSKPGHGSRFTVVLPPAVTEA